MTPVGNTRRRCIIVELLTQLLVPGREPAPILMAAWHAWRKGLGCCKVRQSGLVQTSEGAFWFCPVKW